MSQCARVLEVLGDGQAHSIEEIHDRAGTMRLNSRVSELRSRGHDIRCWRTRGPRRATGQSWTYWYRLLSKSGVGTPSSPPSSAGNGGQGRRRMGREPIRVTAALAPPAPEQPTLFDLPKEPAWA